MGMRIESNNFFERKSSTLNALSKDDSIPCIFTANKPQQVNNVQPEQITENDVKLQEVIDKETNEIYEIGNFEKEVKIVDKVKDALENSINKEFSIFANFIEQEKKKILVQKGELFEHIDQTVQNCKSESDVKNALAKIKQEVAQLKSKIKSLASRAQKAMQLDSVLLNLDNEKREKINTAKIIEDLMKPIGGDNGSSGINEDSSAIKGDSDSKDNLKNSLEDDEISNKINKLLKYIDGGIQNDTDEFEDYIKEEPDKNQASNNNIFSNKNLFGMNTSDLTKRKNPFQLS